MKNISRVIFGGLKPVKFGKVRNNKGGWYLKITSLPEDYFEDE